MADLENFYPDRMADRILGMGDIVSLVEEAQAKLDEKQAEKTSRRMMQGQFDLTDMLSMMKQMNKLGPVGKIIRMMPGAPTLTDEQAEQADRVLKRTEVIISSMTRDERKRPEIIKANRKIRIANGAGATPKEVNQVLQSYDMMKDKMKMMKNNPYLMKKMLGR